MARFTDLRKLHVTTIWYAQAPVALAKIAVSLRLEVPVAVATLHELARHGRYKADDDFLSS